MDKNAYMWSLDFLSVWVSLGHSNWIISFPLTACIPTLHPHVLILSRYFLVIDKKLFHFSYYGKEYFSFVRGDLYYNFYTNRSAFLTKSEHKL